MRSYTAPKCRSRLDQLPPQTRFEEIRVKIARHRRLLSGPPVEAPRDALRSLPGRDNPAYSPKDHARSCGDAQSQSAFVPPTFQGECPHSVQDELQVSSRKWLEVFSPSDSGAPAKPRDGARQLTSPSPPILLPWPDR